jgi:hypothetical protein
MPVKDTHVCINSTRNLQIVRFIQAMEYLPYQEKTEQTYNNTCESCK